jgi:flagellar motor switch protein FliM
VSRILSQEEVDALILSAPGGSGSVDDGASATAYNFRRPDRVSKDQIRSLHILHDRFARSAATSLSAYLRTTTELSIVSVEQSAYSEFLMALPDPTAFYSLAMPPGDSLGALELNPNVAFALIDRLLGGSGESAPPERALTEIEQNVVEAVVKLLLEHLTETWRTVTEIQFQIQGRETRPQMLQVASWNEVIIQVTFDVKVGETRGLLNLCVPASVIEASGSSFVQGWQQARREPTPSEQQWLTENLGRALLPVTTELGTSLKTRELLSLDVGDVLSLGVPADSEVDIRVANLVKFKGRLASRAGLGGVRISRSFASPAGRSGEVQA